MKLIKNIVSFFPVQLLLINIRKHLLILLLWGLVIAAFTGNLGAGIGIHWLFLEPEYLGRTSFVSFLIIGLALGTLSMSYNITLYILDAYTFTFLARMRKPLLVFVINNCLIPLTVLILYLTRLAVHHTWADFFVYGSSLLLGFVLIQVAIGLYFYYTNVNIFTVLSAQMDRGLKISLPLSKAAALSRIKQARIEKPQTRYYISSRLKLQSLNLNLPIFNRETLIKVIDQNHLNAALVAVFLIGSFLLMGLVKNQPALQIPAASSGILLLCILTLLIGAFTYWFRKWALIGAFGLLFIANLMVGRGILHPQIMALGLDYNITNSYDLGSIEAANTPDAYENDYNYQLQMLDNWRAQLDQPPKLFLVAASGGGMRAALWTFTTLQELEETHPDLMPHVKIITGSSGGILGAAYFRELFLRYSEGQLNDLNSSVYPDKLSRDLLNPIIFTLLIHDITPWGWLFQKDKAIRKDRGYVFEKQLHLNTDSVLYKPLGAYRLPEAEGKIPQIIINPVMLNDGRKLYISPHPISFMCSAEPFNLTTQQSEIKGIDFVRFFNENQALSMHFSSALRMGATFPYIAPNINLPTQPITEIMDAGISDNFGISDALRFTWVFRDWISENTSGVVLLSIRDSEKRTKPKNRDYPSLVDRTVRPITGITEIWAELQDIRNDDYIEFATDWLDVPLYNLMIQYVPGKKEERASLSWRLTEKEKESIRSSIQNPANQRIIDQIGTLLR